MAVLYLLCLICRFEVRLGTLLSDSYDVKLSIGQLIIQLRTIENFLYRSIGKYIIRWNRLLIFKLANPYYIANLPSNHDFPLHLWKLINLLMIIESLCKAKYLFSNLG